MTNTITLPRSVIEQAIDTIGYYASVAGEDDQDTPAKQMQAALRAALAQQDEQGWQPIESAPKDRTVVLLLRRKKVMAGAFHAELGKFPWLIIEESRDGINGLEDSIHGPTHWMPLPDSPKGGV